MITFISKNKYEETIKVNMDIFGAESLDLMLVPYMRFRFSNVFPIVVENSSCIFYSGEQVKEDSKIQDRAETTFNWLSKDQPEENTKFIYGESLLALPDYLLQWERQLREPKDYLLIASPKNDGTYKFYLYTKDFEDRDYLISRIITNGLWAFPQKFPYTVLEQTVQEVFDVKTFFPTISGEGLGEYQIDKLTDRLEPDSFEESLSQSYIGY